MTLSFRSLRVEAVVLRHTDFGEADRLITLYSRELGKVRAVAKGVRKITSRKAGHLELFTRVKLQLARSRDLFVITQAEAVDIYPALRQDLTLTGYAAYALELLDRFVPDEEVASPSLFHLLTETLSRLARRPWPWLTLRYYEMRLLDLLGFRPQLMECTNCHQAVQPEDQFFSPSLGGVICRRCGQGLPGLWPISMQALKYLRHFQRSDYLTALRARPTSAAQRELEAIMQGYFQFLLERRLHTPDFLRQIRGG